MGQGNRVLTAEDFQQVALPPADLEASPLDAHLQARFVLEQIVRNLPQRRHVLRSVKGAGKPILGQSSH